MHGHRDKNRSMPPPDVALPAKNLHHTIGDATAHLGCKVLAHRDVHRDILPVVTLARRREDQRTRSLDLDLAIRKHGLHELEFADGAPDWRRLRA